MRTVLTRILITIGVCALVLAIRQDTAQAVPGLSIEAYVWQFDRDYPEGTQADSAIPLNTVYIKTHDATDWMSTYDSHPAAVSGPASITNLIQVYNQQGIEVSAWFVPKGLDYDRQVQMAIEVIDAGVSVLYADLEPFAGFCNQDCDLLGEHFWPRVRQARPNATLGVIYDPREWWWDQSATKQWLVNANIAQPMCYWETYGSQVPYGDPQGCIAQGKADLIDHLAPGRTIEYVPALQGDSNPDSMRKAMDASFHAEATGVSLWRRGVVSNDVWNGIAGYTPPSGPHCALTLIDGCVVKEASVPAIWQIAGGARLLIGEEPNLGALGLTPRDVQTVPSELLHRTPTIPVDGTLLREAGSNTTHVTFGGAKWVMPDSDYGALGLNPSAVRTVVPGATVHLGSMLADYSRMKQVGDSTEYVVLGGARIPLDEDAVEAMKAIGKENAPRYTLPTTAYSQVPLANIKRGDSDCDGIIALIDVVRVMQKTIGIQTGGLCLHVAGDVTCDERTASQDALLILSHVVGVPPEPSDCPGVGIPEPAALPAQDSEPAATPTPTASETTPPTTAASESDTPTASPNSSETLAPTPTPDPNATIPATTQPEVPTPSPET